MHNASDSLSPIKRLKPVSKLHLSSSVAVVSSVTENSSSKLNFVCDSARSCRWLKQFVPHVVNNKPGAEKYWNCASLGGSFVIWVVNRSRHSTCIELWISLHGFHVITLLVLLCWTEITPILYSTCVTTKQQRKDKKITDQTSLPQGQGSAAMLSAQWGCTDCRHGGALSFSTYAANMLILMHILLNTE